MEGTYPWGPQWAYACFFKPCVALSCIYIELGLVSSFGWWDVQFTHSVVSDSLWSHGLQQARPPCPSLTSRAYSNSSPLHQWCHPTISSSVVPFSSCLQCFPASGSFQWVSSSHQVAKVLEFQLQHQSWWDVSKNNANRGLLSFMHWNVSPWSSF